MHSTRLWALPFALSALALVASAAPVGAQALEVTSPSHSTLPESPGAVQFARLDTGAPPEWSSSAAPNFVGSGIASPDPAQPAAADAFQGGQSVHPRPPARATDVTVLPGQVAPSQTVRDKMVGSVRDSVSPFTLIGETASAGYSHLTNGSPNYGTDSRAFGQRFGAAVARGTSQNLFYEGVMASVLHEDPRYYLQGPKVPFFRRVAYAATRPLITRTDGGHTTPNLALLSGYFGAAALTKVYYPPLNQGFNQTLQTFGGSIGGAAIGFLATEFLPDALQILHLKRRD